MKTTIIALAAAAAALTVSANAQTTIEIVGSTAGRKAVHNNIVALMGNLTYAYDGTSGSPEKATYAIYKGDVGGEDYTIRTYWSGSVNGITPVVSGTPITQFLPTSQVTTGGGTFISGNVSASGNLTAGTPDIGYSDVFATTAFVTGTDVEDEVGVITFQWYANEGTTGITNITNFQIRALYAGSELPKSVFTGNAADDVHTVFPTGRNNSSGTRLTAMADSGYGTKPLNTVDQYTFTVSSGAITGQTAVGNGGYSSGSSIATVMNATWDGGDDAVIGYLGSTDFAVDGVDLTYNGVPYSEANIQNGSYSFWGYLHMNRMNTLTGPALDFYDALYTAILADPLDTGVLVETTMNVKRTADGGVIEPK